MNFARLKDSVCILTSLQLSKMHLWKCVCSQFFLWGCRLSIDPFPLEPAVFPGERVTERNYNYLHLHGQRRRKPTWGKKDQRYPGIWVLVLFLTEVYLCISPSLGKFSHVLRNGPKNLVKVKEANISILFCQENSQQVDVFLAITLRNC